MDAGHKDEWHTGICTSMYRLLVPHLLDLILGCGFFAYFRFHYSHSRKTMNTKENFWNVYCFATNQKRDETAKITAEPQHGLVTT